MLLLLLAWGAPPARAAEAPLAARLDAVLQSRALRGARVGALVVSRDDGRVLYAHGADDPLVPASNQKILTALAALATFGPTHRFVTTVFADGPPDAEGTVGTLYLRGGGDPSLGSEDWWRLAAELRAAGLRQVRGALVLDDSWFDAERWHPSWGAVSSRAYYGPVSALGANQGTFAVEVRPGVAVGAPARVALDPPLPWLRLANRVRTADVRSFDVAIERDAAEDGEAVLVTGRAPVRGGVERLAGSVDEPTRYAGALFRWQLEALGVTIAGPVRLGISPADAHPLVAFEGRPLAEIVRLFLKESNNNVAEALVKAIGAHDLGPPGTWERGMAASSARLRALGLDLAGAHLVDGSGLSRENRVTPRLLVAALRIADGSFRFGPEFESALPIAARDGTLAHRGRAIAGHVRAKTGHLDGVSALSGYAALGGGGEAVFSVLVNGAPAGDAAALGGVDAFASALVGAGAKADPGARTPSSPLQESVRRANR